MMDWTEEQLLRVARESVRQVEMRLDGALASRMAMEMRATSVLSWSIGAAVGLAVTTSRATASWWFALSGGGFLLAGAISICALWPRHWYYKGNLAASTREAAVPSEQATLAAYAAGMDLAVQHDAAQLKRLSWLVKAAWLAFAAAGALSLVPLLSRV